MDSAGMYLIRKSLINEMALRSLYFAAVVELGVGGVKRGGDAPPMSGVEGVKRVGDATKAPGVGGVKRGGAALPVPGVGGVKRGGHASPVSGAGSLNRGVGGLAGTDIGGV